MNYGKIISLSDEQAIEGYYLYPPCKGERFILHGNPEVKDMITNQVMSVYQVPTTSTLSVVSLSTISTILFPREARPGDFYFITDMGSYLLQPYHPTYSGDAA
jgi:hypothetical protein